MNVTEFIVLIIGLLSAVITALIIPYIKNKTTAQEQAVIKAIIKTAVYAAQQLFTDNPEKKKYALSYVKETLKRKGIDFDAEEISAQIEAQVKEIKSAITNEWG